MKTTKTVPALLFLSLLALSVPAQAGVIDPFIRAGVDTTKLNALDKIRDDSGWKDKLSGWNASYFAEAGITFLGSHTLSIEAGYMKADRSTSATESGIQSRQQIPLLLNYRYSFLNLGPVGIHLGVSAGMMSDTAKWREDISGAGSSWQTFKSGNWVGVYGATAGVALKLGSHWGIDVGVRALAVSEKTFQDNTLPDAENYKIGKSSVYIRPNLRLALSYRW